MHEKAKFAVKVLKQYAKENSVLPRSTSNLSQLEQWLILQLKASQEIKIPDGIPIVVNTTTHVVGDKIIHNKEELLKYINTLPELKEGEVYYTTLIKEELFTYPKITVGISRPKQLNKSLK